MVIRSGELRDCDANVVAAAAAAGVYIAAICVYVCVCGRMRCHESRERVSRFIGVCVCECMVRVYVVYIEAV